MRFLCRIFGHVPSHSNVQRDPQTFKEYTVCKRCAAPLVQDGESWRERTPED